MKQENKYLHDLDFKRTAVPRKCGQKIYRTRCCNMHPTFFLVAAVLIAIPSVQFASLGLAARRSARLDRSRQFRRLEKHRNAAQIARLASELESADCQKAGRPWRVMEVVKVVTESDDAKSFYLADPYGQPLPPFHPGQYIMVRPGLAGAYQTTRCYSLSVAPNSKWWRITVKWQKTESPPRADRKTGALSQWLHENIRDGDCLLVGGPGGHFYLPAENTSPLVLLAAGVGITPMISMLQHSQLKTPSRPVSLYFQVKDLDQWPLGREAHASCRDRSKPVRVVTYTSQVNPETFPRSVCENFPGQFRGGKLDIPTVVAETAASDAHYFMCGPDAWMELMRKQLAEAGVPEGNVHWESFGGTPPSLGEKSAGSLAHSVEFARSKTLATWANPEQSLWELAQSNDVSIPSGCLSGVCGSCRVKLLKGSVEYDRKVNLSLADDECLPCIARPKSDLKVDA